MTSDRLDDDWNDITDSYGIDFNAEQIRVNIKSISLLQMVDMIDKNGFALPLKHSKLNPWSDAEKSLLIESLMIRLPLPAFYVYEDKEVVWHIIDGLKRVDTIYSFLKGKFALKGLEYLGRTHNDKSFEQIEQKFKYRIKTTSLQFNVIESSTPVELREKIIRRINSAGIA